MKKKKLHKIREHIVSKLLKDNRIINNKKTQTNCAGLVQDYPRTHTRKAEQENVQSLGSFKSMENQNSLVTSGGVNWKNVFGERLIL